MNKRIEKMMLDATKNMPQGYYVPGEYFEKFADMIVTECADIADIKRDTSAGCGYVTQTTGQRIKKHFGVDV
jgi:hypothetical protein